MRRRDSEDYLRNVLTIRTTTPPKPWPKMDELSIILALDRLDHEVGQTLMRLWRHTFYPYRLYIPLPPADLARLNIEMPNVVLRARGSAELRGRAGGRGAAAGRGTVCRRRADRTADRGHVGGGSRCMRSSGNEAGREGFLLAGADTGNSGRPS